tara:strand:+ start:2347 stop:3507 length:1161 start_codon:yes stop_codon:yes gene_type:complete
MYLFFSFGISVTIVGLVMGKYKSIIIEVFSHYYLPSVFYFISRKYTSYSILNFSRIIHLLWIIAIFMLIDITAEWLLFENDLRNFVPWSGLGSDQEGLVQYSEDWYGLGFDKIGSILTSSKATEMLLASLFCFFFPISLQKIKYPSHMRNIWTRNNTFIIALLFMILIGIISILRLTNKTSLTAMILFLAIYIVRKVSFRGALLILIMGLSIFFIFYEFLAVIFFDNFIKVYYKWGGSSEGRTVLEQIFDVPRLLKNYDGISFFDCIFGKYVASGINSTKPFSDASIGTELRLLTSPVYFGFIFTGIVLSMVLLVVKYCYDMTNQHRVDLIHFLGFSFLGFYFIIFADIHYPVFYSHGILELIFILTGALSSFHSKYLFKENSFRF